MVGREGLEPITWWSHNPLRYLFANVPMYMPVFTSRPDVTFGVRNLELWVSRATRPASGIYSVIRPSLRRLLSQNGVKT